MGVSLASEGFSNKYEQDVSKLNLNVYITYFNSF